MRRAPIAEAKGFARYRLTIRAITTGRFVGGPKTHVIGVTAPASYRRLCTRSYEIFL